MASANTRRDVAKEGSDLYITPEIALTSFYKQFRRVIDQHQVFLDPCDGMGAISDFLESIGKKVYRWDLYNYSGKLDKQCDFLESDSISEDVECIIFNPPFKMTGEFVDKALHLCPNLIMFNRMTTIESNVRAAKLASGEWPLKNMFQYGFRVSCDKGEYDEKGDLVIEKTANSVAYSIFEFDMYSLREPKLHWILKEGE